MDIRGRKYNLVFFLGSKSSDYSSLDMKEKKSKWCHVIRPIRVRYFSYKVSIYTFGGHI